MEETAMELVNYWEMGVVEEDGRNGVPLQLVCRSPFLIFDKKRRRVRHISLTSVGYANATTFLTFLMPGCNKLKLHSRHTKLQIK